MVTRAHSAVSVAARHPIPKYEYANAAARTGATGFVSGDLNAVAHQQDNDTYWILTATTPTWLQIATGGPASGFTTGSVIFAGATGALAEDNANLFWDDTGNALGVGVVSPSYRLTIGSTDKSDTIGIYHDNTNAFFKTTDGNFIFLTDEGTNTNTIVEVKGKGTGRGFLHLYDPDDAEYLQMYCLNGISFINTMGIAPGGIWAQAGGEGDFRLYTNTPSGVTREFFIYGYRTGDAKRSLEIGVGVDAADTASFDGVSNYSFDGNVSMSGGLLTTAAGDFTTTIGNGSAVVKHSAPVELADDGNFDLPNASAGFGFFMAGNGEEYGQVSWDSNGVVTQISGSANFSTTDTGTGTGKFCIFDNGTQVRVTNRLGAAKKITFQYNYYTP